MTVTVNTDIGGAAISGQGGGGDVASVNGQTGVVELVASDVGAAAASFTTITVSGQSNVVADTTTDTLTLAAGTGISITTNATTDTVTITNSGGTPTTGSFTPVLVSSGGGTPTYNQRAGSYMSFGNRLFFSLRIWLTDKGTMGAGSLTVTGLPTASVNTTGLNHVFETLCVNNAVLNFDSVTTQLPANSSTIELLKVSGATVTSYTLADAGTDLVLVVTGSYAIS